MVSYIICNTKHLHQFPQSLTKTTITFESQYSLLSQVASRFVPSSPTFTLYHVKKQHEGSFKNKLLHWLCEGFSASYANSRNFHTAGSPWAKKKFCGDIFCTFWPFWESKYFYIQMITCNYPFYTEYKGNVSACAANNWKWNKFNSNSKYDLISRPPSFVPSNPTVPSSPTWRY